MSLNKRTATTSIQVADSLGHLDKKKGRGIDAVTAVRVSADDRETQRRMAEEHARQERLQRLQVTTRRFWFFWSILKQYGTECARPLVCTTSRSV